MSLRIVQIDRTSRVSWQDSPGSLTRLQPPTKAQTSHRPSIDAFAREPSRFHKQSPSYTKSFPVNNLAPVSQKAYPTQHHPPTPPPDDEPDAMDWTPTHALFQPVPVHAHTQKAPITTVPSPFHGRIPAAPQSQAQKLRNPQNQPSFRKTPPEKQQNFFATMTQRVSPQNNQQNLGRLHKESPTLFEMAPPKFFPRDNLTTDTGLENLFNSAFSLKDEPPEIQAARERQARQGRRAWGRIAGIWSGRGQP